MRTLIFWSAQWRTEIVMNLLCARGESMAIVLATLFELCDEPGM